VIFGKGRMHDFSLFKQSHFLFHPDTLILADSGYQGLKKYHSKSEIPLKKTKKTPLTKEQKKENRSLSKRRILIENIFRRCKIFRIVKEVYRGKHKNYSLNWNIVAALVNLRYSNI
jgi:IS5 family transposase